MMRLFFCPSCMNRVQHYDRGQKSMLRMTIFLAVLCIILGIPACRTAVTLAIQRFAEVLTLRE
jgi:hypothetical protein